VIGILKASGHAFGFHYTVASRREMRAVGIEVAPGQFQVTEIGDRYVHSNHYVSDEMRDEKLIASRPNTVIRYETAQRRLAALGADTTLPRIGGILASHDEEPHTVCAHPGEKLSRATLASLLLDASDRVMRIYTGNPCAGVFRDYVV
jgi:hypothetical protein